MTLNETYQDKLIEKICSAGHPTLGPVTHDGQAWSVYVEHRSLTIYCTPGWEGDWNGMPLEILDDDGDLIDGGWQDAEFTGDLARDYQTWATVVENFYQTIHA